MKIRTLLYVFFLGAISSAFPQGRNDAEVRAFAEEISGQRYWLKIDVVRVKRLIGGTDATNIYPDGRVSYRGSVGKDGLDLFTQSQSSSAEDFAEQARGKGNYLNGNVRVYNRGSKVTVHKVKLGKKDIKVEITEAGGSKTAVRLKFNKAHYTVEEFRQSFWHAFALRENELQGADKTIDLQMGMSVESVIAAKGKPNTRVNLGSKTVLTYRDMKVIFKDNKLSDVQ